MVDKFIKAAKHFNLIGDAMLVQEIPLEVKRDSGIILSSKEVKRDSLRVVKVLAVNENLDPDADATSLQVEPGNLVVVGELSTKWTNYFAEYYFEDGNRVGICRESDIQLLYKDQTHYDKVSSILRASKKSA